MSCRDAVMKIGLYETRVNNLIGFKQRLIEAWSGLQQNIVDAAIGKWKKRLRARVRTHGRHFRPFTVENGLRKLKKKLLLTFRLRAFVDV